MKDEVILIVGELVPRNLVQRTEDSGYETGEWRHAEGIIITDARTRAGVGHSASLSSARSLERGRLLMWFLC